MSILAGASVTMLTGMFDSNIRSGQIIVQHSSVQQAAGYLNAHIASGERPINTLHHGLAGKPNAVDALALNQDQFLMDVDGDCYRFMYFKAAGTIRAAKSSHACGDASIRPTRLPNQPGSTPADPILDDLANKSFVLMSGISPTDASGQPAAPVFSFLDDTNSTLNTDPGADLDNPAAQSIFADANDNESAIKQVAAVKLTANVLPVEADQAGTSKIHPFAWTQRFSLDADNGAAGGAGGGEAGAQGPAGQGVAAGGSTGQVLAKTSGADYDTHWTDPASNQPEAWRLVGQSGQPAFENSWTSYSATDGPVAFRKYPDGTVRLRGTIAGGATTTVAFTLPSGYRPQYRWRGYAMYDQISATAAAQINVQDDGTVMVFFSGGGTGRFISLDQVSFSTT